MFAKKLLRSGSRMLSTTVNPPRLFSYDTITKNLKPSVDMVSAIESAFGMLSKGLVDVTIKNTFLIDKQFQL